MMWGVEPTTWQSAHWAVIAAEAAVPTLTIARSGKPALIAAKWFPPGP